MRERARAVLFLAAILVLLAPASRAERTTLVILHTNDVHSAYLPSPASWRDDHSLMGGTAALDALIQSERARWQHLLLLDAGDILTGTPLSDIEVDGVKGGAMLDIMHRLRYDAATIGNHEFDHGADNVRALVAAAPFPFLCANLFWPDGTLYAHAPGKLFELGELRVAVVGLITPELSTLLHGEALKAFRATPPADAAREWYASLSPRPDLFVALTHMGVDLDEELARQLPELDLIVGGHSHTRLEKGRQVGSTLVVQGGSGTWELGRVRLELEDGELRWWDAELLEVFAQDVRTRPEIDELVRGYEQRIQEEYGEVLGTLETAWIRKGEGDSNVGSWIADHLADELGSDFGLMNTGGIRKDIDAGPITRLDVVEMFPFQNEAVSFEISGAELLSMLRSNARRMANGQRGTLQLGHLRSNWATRFRELVLVSPTIRGQPIDPSRRYRGASVDYVVLSQAEHLLGAVPRDVKLSGKRLAALVEDWIRREGVVDFSSDGRLGPADDDR